MRKEVGGENPATGKTQDLSDLLLHRIKLDEASASRWESKVDLSDESKMRKAHDEACKKLEEDIHTAIIKKLLEFDDDAPDEAMPLFELVRNRIRELRFRSAAFGVEIGRNLSDEMSKIKRRLAQNNNQIPDSVVVKTLKDHGGNVSQAAAKLDVERVSLSRRIGKIADSYDVSRDVVRGVK